MAPMKLDVNLGVEGGYLKSVEGVAKAADDLGFSGLITSETKHDAYLPLAIAANATERLELLTSVAIAFSRSPMETAQTAWDLQSLSDGRLILGLGTQVKAHVTRRFSMPWDKPVARMRDYIGALRAIWESFQSEGPLNYEGEFYRHTLMTPFFNPGPIERPEIPVYIAGVNESLARLAGEVCDGFHVHPFHSPKYIREVVRPAISSGAEKAGRESEEVKLAVPVFAITGADGRQVEKQREAMRQQAAFYASTPTYRTVLEVHGWGEVGERLSTLAREKRWSEMPALITDEMLAEFAVEGEPDEIGDRIRERYSGLVERVALYMPFVPGERDRFWRNLIESVTA
ncbi:putative F420-dependent oxidoreductase, MSMEG_2256 family [Rubrobacter radiotolerans]|uniref:LLM class F420-dependent oxidoreductase n=1 Tax=Rubrobacter radiotolerans TaxID=42256 RepID=A0A023X248_RUBRA|nr:LLM class F420-dependent oxidoreductase [Rubrobacter radiotolerans]AHY46124.1 putative F420-dependent oxidoreductase, MSMEG_2256 family [Rubrobacter radiotolerans]MDX5893534.1 LLM class F420-dependent oxidoreductase [Rubrobacter radiotolerans]SMC03937.1 probable F420-dependent oxidoreductase, MSMEG_2256 family [Rubrobacter radiotolerans DSM 5868]